MTAPTPVDLPDGFGPDFTTTAQDPQPPKASQDNPPRKAKDTRRGFSLGDNKKARSGVRKLTEDDKPKLAGWYRAIAKGAKFFRPQLAMAINAPGQIDLCVDAWFELAEENDKVRRAICGMIEGGGWGKVLLAHLPFFIAVLPEAFVQQFLAANLMDILSMTDGDEQSSQDMAMPSFMSTFPFSPGHPTYPADVQQDPNVR